MHETNDNKEASVATLEAAEQAEEQAEESREGAEQKPSVRELIGATIQELQKLESGLEYQEDNDAALRKESIERALDDIRTALAPPTEEEKKDPRFDSKLNLIIAYQGLQEIKKEYGDVAGVDSIEETLNQEMQERGIEGIEQFKDLDAALETAKTETGEAIRKGSEKMDPEEAKKVAENIETYRAVKQEIARRQQQITGGAKNFYSALAQRVTKGLEPIVALGEKIDEKFAATDPRNAILGVVKRFGENERATKVAERVVLSLGVLTAGLILFRPWSAEAASHQSESHSESGEHHPVPDAGHKLESAEYQGSASPEVNVVPGEISTSEEKISQSQTTITRAQEKIKAIEEESNKHFKDDKKMKEAVEEIGTLRHIIQTEEAKIEQIRHEHDPVIEVLREKLVKAHRDTNFFEGRTGLMTKEQKEKLQSSLGNPQELYTNEGKLAVAELDNAHGTFHLEVGKQGTIQDFQEQSMWVQRATMEGKNLSPQEKNALTQKFIALQEAIIKGAHDGIKEAEQKLSAAHTFAITQKYMSEIGKYNEALKLAEGALKLVKQPPAQSPKPH